MSDVFVSYASADRPGVKPLVDALRQQGWSVWWDRTILPGKTWDQVIEAALADARCVIVVWSRDSIQSDWVRTEADEGKRRGILVPALLDEVNIPLAFKRIQAANLVDWSGGLPSAGFDELARAVSEILSHAAPLGSKATGRAASAASASTAPAPEGSCIERAEASQEADERQVRAETSGGAKTERERLASEAAAKPEPSPPAVATKYRPPWFSVRAQSTFRKGVIIFGLAAAALSGIVIYTQTRKEVAIISSPTKEAGAAVSPPTHPTSLVPSQVRKSPPDRLDGSRSGEKALAPSTITISFDVWYDLGRVPTNRNKVKLSNELLATVIYGSDKIDVRDIDLASVHLSDGTGSGVPVVMYHLIRGYDENNDGRDDLKLDFRLDDLRTSGNLAQLSNTLRLTGYLKNHQPFNGEQNVTFIP